MIPSPAGITPDPVYLPLFGKKIKTAWALSPFWHQACVLYLRWHGNTCVLQLRSVFFPKKHVSRQTVYRYAQNLPWLLFIGNKGTTWFGDEPFDTLTHITCTTGLYASVQEQGGTMVLYISCPCRVQCCSMGCLVAPAKNRNCKNPVNSKKNCNSTIASFESQDTHLHPSQSLLYLVFE